MNFDILKKMPRSDPTPLIIFGIFVIWIINAKVDTELCATVKNNFTEIKTSFDNCVIGLNTDACTQCEKHYVAMHQLYAELNWLKGNKNCSKISDELKIIEEGQNIWREIGCPRSGW